MKVFRRQFLLSLADPDTSILTMRQVQDMFPLADFSSITATLLGSVKTMAKPIHSLGEHNLRALTHLMLKIEVGKFPQLMGDTTLQYNFEELNGDTVYHVQSATKRDLPSQLSHLAGFNILNLFKIHHSEWVKSLSYKYSSEMKQSNSKNFTPAHYFWSETKAIDIFHKGNATFDSAPPTAEQFKEVHVLFVICFTSHFFSAGHFRFLQSSTLHCSMGRSVWVDCFTSLCKSNIFSVFSYFCFPVPGEDGQVCSPYQAI